LIFQLAPFRAGANKLKNHIKSKSVKVEFIQGKWRCQKDQTFDKIVAFSN